VPDLSRLSEKVTAALAVEARKHRYRDDPVLWATEYLGLQLWSKQKEILYSIRDNRNTAVAAGRGVGKSFVAAVAMCWWVDVHPIGVDESGAPQTFVASTAPFAELIGAILWNNMKVLHALSRKRHEEFKRRQDEGEPLDDFAAADHPLPGYITGDNKWKTNDGILIGQGRKPPDNATESGFSGYHATYLLAIGDEAAGLSKEMIDNLRNITTGAENRLLLIANPTDPTSAMASIWQKDKATWTTMHISVLDSPKITNEEGFDASRITAMSGQDFIDEVVADYGEESADYKINVLGEWAFERGNNVFTDVVIAKAANTCVMADEVQYIQVGMDVARGETDYTELYAAYRGTVWTTDDLGNPLVETENKGLRVRHVKSWLNTPATSRDPERPGSAERANDIVRELGAAVIAVDAAGFGRAVSDALFLDLAEGRYGVVEVFGSKPSNDTRTFVNIRAEAIFEIERKMSQGEIDIDGSDDELLAQLRRVVFEYTDKGQRKIESKDSMKKRGLKSPDKVDALWYAATDFSPLVEDPYAGMKAGDKIPLDFDDFDLDSLPIRAGIPW
jgi:hypothetical protein